MSNERQIGLAMVMYSQATTWAGCRLIKGDPNWAGPYWYIAMCKYMGKDLSKYDSNATDPVTSLPMFETLPADLISKVWFSTMSGLPTGERSDQLAAGVRAEHEHIHGHEYHA